MLRIAFKNWRDITKSFQRLSPTCFAWCICEYLVSFNTVASTLSYIIYAEKICSVFYYAACYASTLQWRHLWTFFEALYSGMKKIKSDFYSKSKKVVDGKCFKKIVHVGIRTSQLVFTCSKLTTERIEQGMKYVHS